MSNLDLSSAVDLSGVLNKPVEDKARQIPDPATFHLLCMVPNAEEEYESGLAKASQTMHYEEVLSPRAVRGQDGPRRIQRREALSQRPQLQGR